MKHDWYEWLGLRRLAARVRLWRARRRGPPYCAVCGERVPQHFCTIIQGQRGQKMYHINCSPNWETTLHKAGLEWVDGRVVPRAILPDDSAT